MRYVSLGGHEVSVVGLGVWQFGSTSWGWNREFGRREAMAVVERALELYGADSTCLALILAITMVSWSMFRSV